MKKLFAFVLFAVILISTLDLFSPIPNIFFIQIIGVIAFLVFSFIYLTEKQ